MKNSKPKKLAKYLSSAGAIVVASSAQADIIYTDINPDSVRAGNNNGVSEYFYIDLNNDSTSDFSIGMKTKQMSVSNTYTYNRVWVKGSNVSSNVTNEIASSSFLNGNIIASELSTTDLINNSKTFSSYELLGIRSYWSTISGSLGGDGSFGNFANQGDKFLGLKLYTNDTTFYFGWARVNVDSAYYGLTIKDYAYNDIAGDSIHAGNAGNLDIATNIVATDISNNNNGTDMQITFDKLADETHVEMYHAIIVKASNSDITLDTIMNLDTLESMEIPVTGSNLSATLLPSSLDSDGDQIAEGVAYKVFIVVQAKDETVYWNHSVSMPSANVTLDGFTSIEGLIENIKVFNSNNQIVIKSEDNLEASVSLISIDGKVVYNSNMNNNQHIINTANITKGIYLVNVKSENGEIFTKKVML